VICSRPTPATHATHHRAGDAATREEQKQNVLMKEILQITADRFPAIGINLPANGYGIVRNDFHNVPARMYSSQGWSYPEPGPSNPCQYFVDP
jgi:peptide/nickel transport system substrate-binding protein